jgi:hypothetical protein
MALDVNPTGLDWRAIGHKRYAMYRLKAPRNSREANWGVFGRVEKDATGQLVASCTQFEHIKYVESFEDGVTHVEAIWALEQGNT